MKRRTMRVIAGVCISGSFIALACKGSSSHVHGAAGSASQPSAPATQSVSDTQDSYVNKTAGVTITYPKTWVPKPSDDFELLLVPKVSADTQNNITLDVPDLPVHIPGLIPLGSVKKGYLNDLKKKQPGLTVVEEKSPSIPKAKADLVRSTWKDKDGHELSETALLMVHADGVYILRADSDDKHYQQTRAVFDGVVDSLKWTEK